MPLSFGILGAARIAPKALIHPARVIPQTRLVAIAARDSVRAQAFADEYEIEQAFARYEDVLNHAEVDVIYNPLPINLHAEWTIKALEAGKHVLCEKPFAMNADEAQAVLETAARTGKRVIEAFHYRYHPAFLTCLDWVNSGQIGDLVEIEGIFNVHIADNGTEIRHRVENGGGAMMDLGCYPLHWALTLMDAAPERIEAQATLTPAGVDESMDSVLHFPGGGKARLRSSMAKGETFRASLSITGSKGRIEFTNALAPHLGSRLTLNADTTETAHISPISTYTWQMAAFIDALKTNTVLPTEGDMVLRQQNTLDGIYEAAGLRSLRHL